MATTTQAPVWIAPGVIRASHVSDRAPYGWRFGVETPDGFWMVATIPWDNTHTGTCVPAVRVILDPTGKDYGRVDMDLYDDLKNAVAANTHLAQDDFLASLSVVSELAPDELTALRDAVLDGRKGGPRDGLPTRRPRSQQSRK